MTHAFDMALPATLTHAQATAVLHQLQKTLLSAKETCVLDASALQQFDSSALAVLLQACRSAQAHGLHWQLEGAPPKLRQLAGLYGVQALLLPAL